MDSLGNLNEGGARFPRDSEHLELNVFNQLLSLQIKELLGTKDSLRPVSTVLGHLKRGFLKKGEKVCVQTVFDLGLRVAKVTRLLEILRYTRV